MDGMESIEGIDSMDGMEEVDPPSLKLRPADGMDGVYGGE